LEGAVSDDSYPRVVRMSVRFTNGETGTVYGIRVSPEEVLPKKYHEAWQANLALEDYVKRRFRRGATERSSNRARVLDAVREGLRTAPEIARKLALPEKHVRSDLEFLVKAGKLSVSINDRWDRTKRGPFAHIGGSMKRKVASYYLSEDAGDESGLEGAMTLDIRIGDMVSYVGERWMVMNKHGYPTKTLDLRRSIVVDPRKRFKDEVENRREVPIDKVQALRSSDGLGSNPKGSPSYAAAEDELNTLMLPILSIDAWGNQEDGYEWNNWRKVGSISKEEFEALDTDKKKIEYMIEAGFLNDKALKLVRVEDDQYNDVFVDDESDEPLYAIEYGPHY
jgi:hypothetical protein